MATERITILVVGADAADARRLQRRLAGQGQIACAMEQADRLAAGLTRLAKGGIDLVLLDLPPPGGEGLEALRAIRQSAPGVPCLALLKQGAKALGLDALQAGAQDCLVEEEIQDSELGRAIRYGVERRRSEEAVRKAYAQTEQLLTAISSILIGLDANGLVTTWNSVAQATFGCPAGAVVGRPLADARLAWETARILEGVAACRRTREPVRVEHVSFTPPEGATRVVGLTINPLKDETGALSGFVILGADISERVKAQEALQAKMAELEFLNRIMTGREERILELKDELKALRAQLGAQAPVAERHHDLPR